MADPTPETGLASGFAAASPEHWRALVDRALKGGDFDKRLVTKTADGLRIEPLYTRSQTVPGTAEQRPGAPPYTRGTQAQRIGLGWDIRSFYSETDPSVANAAIHEDLNGGVNSIALHIGPTALPPSREAMTTALSGVLLDACPVVLVAGEQTFDAATALMSIWTASGLRPVACLGAFGADPVSMLAVTGRLSEPVSTALARAIALMQAAADKPHVTALTADGVAYHNAGASEGQELACMLASFVAYLRAAEQAGIAPQTALPKIAVSLAADADEFSTIAKLRAARHLVWRVAEACGAGEAAAQVQFACPTSYRMMAKRDPWTNILRTTIACTGAALGGADAILVLPFTFALGKTDAFARRVARNIQIVCQEESNLGRVSDPAGGSWYVETLTAGFAKTAWEIFQEIEAQGGIAAGLQSSFIQDTIAKTSEARAKAIRTGKEQLTGVSAFPLLGNDGVSAEPWPKPRQEPRPASGAAPREPAITVKPLHTHRLAEPFEALRDASDTHGGFKVFLASMGEVIEHNVRTTWIKNYLAAGGIESLISDGFESAEAAAAAFKTSGASAACICSSDAVNATLAEPTARALKAAGAKLVLMAGRPGDNEAALRAAGVDQFLFAGADAIAVLTDLQTKLG